MDLNSPIILEFIKKLVTESNRATTDSSASVESSPLKDILVALEKNGFSNLNLEELVGSFLKGGLGNLNLGGILGSIAGALGGLGGAAKNASTEFDGVMADVAAAGKKLSSLDPSSLTPERGRLVDILGKALSFIQKQA